MTGIRIDRKARTAFGTSAKVRRGAGWGGKGSLNDDRLGQWRRGYVPYRSKRGRSATRWWDGVQNFAGPHQGARECARRAKA